MLKFAKSFVLACALFTTASVARAQTHAATIDDAAWMAGRWVGEGFGGQMEEVWSPPIGGQMIGHFRYWRDGQPQFYEIMMMDIDQSGVRMRVKHFNPDFTGWEDRGEWVTFEPVSAAADALIFNGLQIRREGEDRIVMTISINRNGVVTDDVLRFQRAPL